MHDELHARPKGSPAERFKVACIFAPILPATGAVAGAGVVAASVLVLLGALIGGAIDGTDLRARARSAIAFGVASAVLFLAVPFSVAVTGGAHVVLDETKFYTWQLAPAFVVAIAALFVVRRLTHGRWGA